MSKILLSHGGGGEEMNSLINDLIFKTFDNEILKECNDSAILGLNSTNIAVSTDSFVITPLFFSGGDIGKISVCGSVNDICMVGAMPKFISVSFIIEEGLDIEILKQILISIKKEADNAGVMIVCGDTKVVPKNKADKIFINTTCVGEIIKPINSNSINVGDKIILSGDIGRHGAVIMANRDEIELMTELKSDCKCLKDEIIKILNAGITPTALRDATRGGVSAVLNELSKQNNKLFEIYEDEIKISPEVLGICELLGLEAYDLANEGTFIAFVNKKDANKTLEILQSFNKSASIIGEVKEGLGVIIKNSYGSSRFLEYPKGELLPRIC